MCVQQERLRPRKRFWVVSGSRILCIARSGIKYTSTSLVCSNKYIFKIVSRKEWEKLALILTSPVKLVLIYIIECFALVHRDNAITHLRRRSELDVLFF